MQECINEQMELFGQQCKMALEFDLPVIIHTRNSFAETWEVLSSLPKMPRGQFHCFSIDEEALKLVLDQRFYVSFCGNITWSKRVAKLVSLVPDDRLILETDSPFMVPRVNGRVVPPSSTREQPSGSRDRNEPANVRILAEKIAELRGQTFEEIEEMTTENANTLYRL
jgi:TatD DNase family protein